MILRNTLKLSYLLMSLTLILNINTASTVYANSCEKFISKTYFVDAESFELDPYIVLVPTSNYDPYISTLMNPGVNRISVQLPRAIALKLIRHEIKNVNTLIRVPVEDYEFLELSESQARVLIAAIAASGQGQVLSYTKGWISVAEAVKILSKQNEI